MAKELPYFQFEPAEYLTKDVSFCSLSAQGLFINLCSYYWQRGCELTTEQLLRRLNYPKELNELIDEKVISIEENDISVKFLDLQYEKATKLSKVNSANGSKGGRPKKTNPIKSEIKPKLNPIKSESKGIRKDNIKKDNIKKEDIITYSDVVLDCLNYSLNFFPKDLQPKNESQADSWLDTLDKLNRIDKHPIKEIKEVIKNTRENDFWSKNFLSIKKLRSKNKDGVSYYQVFKNQNQKNTSIKKSSNWWDNENQK